MSFSFRGNEPVREAMHAAFLYHAIQAGMDMGIVNAGQLAIYENVDKELMERVEDVILNRRPDATERLVTFAEKVQGGGKERVEDLSWRELPVEDRLAHALVNGAHPYAHTDPHRHGHFGKHQAPELNSKNTDRYTASPGYKSRTCDIHASADLESAFTERLRRDPTRHR